MKVNIRALLIVYTGLFLCLNLSQCSSLRKIAPEHKGVDPRAEHFVKEFKELAKMQGITFKHEVSIGFKNINEGSTIGLTSYGPGNIWIEIDLDESYWNRSTEISRFTLIMHEAGHAYCGRDHDWGKGHVYPEYSEWKGKEPTEGRYKDGSHCPLSIMYPTILEDFCMLIHFNDYVVELYNRCRPY